jgi:antitoxin HicB
MLAYPARLVPEPDGQVMLILPDVPEVVVVAVGVVEAFHRAPAVLESVLAGYVLDHRPIPSPSDICGAPKVATDKFSVLGVE